MTDQPDPVPIVPLSVAPDSLRHVSVALEGRARIRTESGTVYEVDFDAMYLRRMRGTIPPQDPEVLPARHLRKDGDVLKILRVITLRVGRPAVFDIQPLGDPRIVAYTRRTTTYVETIERMGAEQFDSASPDSAV